MRATFGMIGAAALLAACSTSEKNPQDAFFANLSQLCGQSFEGAVISDEEADADWRKETLTIQVKDCSGSEIRIPLHVGENRSRTWVISKTDGGLRLKHDHRHEDGSPDIVSQYGGDTQSKGTSYSQSFPVDEFSKKLFKLEGLDVSVTNVWALTIEPHETLTYKLSRPGRLFEAQFDLTKAVPAPPPAWGDDD